MRKRNWVPLAEAKTFDISEISRFEALKIGGISIRIGEKDGGIRVQFDF